MVKQSPLTTKIIDYYKAKDFTVKWHYSKTMPKNTKYCFAWGDYAVAVFGIPPNRNIYKFLSRKTQENITRDNLLELTRLCRVEPKRENLYLSQFLSHCFKNLKQKEIKYIISYSDLYYNHTGGVYKATNFIFLGKTKKQLHFINKKGNLLSKKALSNYAKYNNITFAEAKRNFKSIYTEEKNRWFYKIR